ncbi:hypothetical protein phiIBBPAA2_0037A [Pseudomonas phage phiIBB-PAA2]|uniref:PD(D/E)XK endonuclease domain-containing protein n=1 Tax=Pseudomonas phage phiIBB-PAA2 TaxID=1429758 RepID=V5R4U4_9CAUD|nr:hypothetical protein phiIBBPAA2_0037A [Pseudomonas phage phiIBB-PAA2]AHB30138.1 hypothetical protein phiIBBPAA2_0037A [Pseudomonas phage phiIBB-PAA2]
MERHSLKHKVGAISEARAKLMYLKRGWEVYSPDMPQSRCDFIVDSGKGLFKVQVKTASWCKTGKFNHCQIRLVNRNGNPYEREDFDLLVVVDADCIYEIPHDDILGRTSLYFKSDNPNPRKLKRDYNPEGWVVTH